MIMQKLLHNAKTLSYCQNYIIMPHLYRQLSNQKLVKILQQVNLQMHTLKMQNLPCYPKFRKHLRPKRSSINISDWFRNNSAKVIYYHNNLYPMQEDNHRRKSQKTQRQLSLISPRCWKRKKNGRDASKYLTDNGPPFGCYFPGVLFL